ncbi:MAG: hypothetical protein P1U74_00860 [Legionellaceae bacterium]|nr:hypothetical protein [Legionellaceae bacterium]
MNKDSLITYKNKVEILELIDSMLGDKSNSQLVSSQLELEFKLKKACPKRGGFFSSCFGAKNELIESISKIVEYKRTVLDEETVIEFN